MKCFPKLCMKDDTIFEPSLDFFFESEHDHGFLWVANALAYGLNFNQIIENFVDKYITCDSDKFNTKPL
jgi:hypothetical protein